MTINIEKQARQRHYNFIIKALKIHTSFQVGNCHFQQLSQEDSSKIFQVSNVEAVKNRQEMKLEDIFIVWLI